MSDKRFEQLKDELFMSGVDAIEEFIGTDPTDWDNDTIDNMMDETYEQMPEEELNKFYEDYGV